ncbi:MAG: YciI family protein [Sulfitobacter sp.]
MFVTLLTHDKPNALAVRQENRPAHLDYLKTTGVVAQAGPLLDHAGEMIGSLIILDVETMADAQAWADADPYAQAGLFQSVTLTHWNRVIG